MGGKLLEAGGRWGVRFGLRVLVGHGREVEGEVIGWVALGNNEGSLKNHERRGRTGWLLRLGGKIVEDAR